MRGHIRRRGARWAVVIEQLPHPETGKRRQKWHAAATKREAEQLLTRLLREQDTGLYTERTKLTLGEQIDDYFATDGLALRATSRDTLVRAARLYVRPALGATPLERLTPRVLSRWLADLQRRGLASSTILVAWHVARVAVGQAARHNLIPRNPCDAVRPPARVVPARPTLAPEQVRDLAAILGRQTLAPLFLLVLGCGLRRGEALGLRWSDVDLAGGGLVVARQSQHRRGVGQFFCPPKTKAGVRAVPIPGFALDALKAHHARQLVERARFGEVWEDGDLVFPRAGGAPLPLSSLEHHVGAMQRALVAAGLPKLSFHDLRHQHASLGPLAGVSPKVMSERLGHASVKLTMDLYTHIAPVLHREAADAIDRLVQPPPSSGGGAGQRGGD